MHGRKKVSTTLFNIGIYYTISIELGIPNALQILYDVLYAYDVLLDR